VNLHSVEIHLQLFNMHYCLICSQKSRNWRLCIRYGTDSFKLLLSKEGIWYISLVFPLST
jgi:hypothetical protein